MFTSLTTAARTIANVITTSLSSPAKKAIASSPWFRGEEARKMFTAVKDIESVKILKPAKELKERFGIHTYTFKRTLHKLPELYVSGKLISLTDRMYKSHAKEAMKGDKKLKLLKKNLDAAIQHKGSGIGRKLSDLTLKVLSSSIIFFPLFCHIYGHPHASYWPKTALTDVPKGLSDRDLQEVKGLVAELENEIKSS